VHEPNDTNRHITDNLKFYEEIEVKEERSRLIFLSDWIRRASSHGPDALVAISTLIVMLMVEWHSPGNLGALLIVGIIGVMLMLCLWIKEVHRGPYPPRHPPNPP